MLSSRAGLSAGHCTLLECKAVTTRLAKLSGLGLASRPAYSSLRREAAAQAAYRRARRLLPITRCDGRTAAQAAHRRMTRLQAGLSGRPSPCWSGAA